MCGIAGIIDLDRKPIQPSLLLAMNEAVAHRGSDDEGYVLIDQTSSRSIHFSGMTSPTDVQARVPLLRSDEPARAFNIGLCHRRFSIIDLSSAGHQPFFDAGEECCIVFNGEIYNYLEVREELMTRGVVFRTQSDTEVLVAAYKYWGADCFEKLNGFWALALYDFKRRTLLLSRDRIGKKPLYWTKSGSRIYFGSEIKALLRIPEVYNQRRVNEETAFDWLVYGRRDLDFSTCFAGVHSLASGSWAVVDETFPDNSKAFWRVPQERLHEREISVHDACRRLRETCTDAVRIRLRCDVPFAVELSGGMDSSVILALASQVSSEKITSYTIHFPDEQYDEEPFARSVASRYELDYRIVDSSVYNFWRQIAPFTYQMEEPYHSPSMYTSQVVWSRMRLSGTKVVLRGAGGDENFAGYGVYFERYQWENLLTGRIDRYLTNGILSSEAGSKPYSLSAPVLGLIKEGVRRYAPRVVDNLREKRSYYRAKRYLRSPDPMGASQTLHDYMTSLLMPYWLRSDDQCQMGIPIEARSPFLDHRVIELAFRMPVTYLIRNGWQKWILRKSMEGLLPQNVVWRKRKMGLPFPYGRFQQESDEIMDRIITQARNPFVDLSQKERLKENWKAMSFILWYELFFNENIDLLMDVQRGPRQLHRETDYGFMPEYLRASRLNPTPPTVLASPP